MSGPLSLSLSLSLSGAKRGSARSIRSALALQPHQRRVSLVSGFTIVELLIVVVVIAILAAITLVSYNGISQQAKASAAQSTASQATKKLVTWSIQNNETYPANKTGFLSAAGLTDPDGITYQYTANTTITPNTFCLTTTTNNISYYTSSTNLTPTAGACPGHGVNGVAAITNLVMNPRATNYSGATGLGNWNSTRWFGASMTGSYSLVSGASDGPLGITTYARKTWATVSNMSASGDTGFDNVWGNIYGIPVTPGQPMALSCYLRPSVNRNFDISVYQYDSTGTAFSTARIYGTTVFGAAGVWTRVSYIYTPVSGVALMSIACDSTSNSANGAVNWAVGSTLDGTGLMITQTSTVSAYADPITNPSSWAWTGAANASTSTGPAL